MRVIAGKYRGKRLSAPKGDNVRPTTDRIKETVFNILQFKIAGARCLDLFAGTGALGIECLSRGADYVLFSDKSPESVSFINENLKGIDGNYKVVTGDFLGVLRTLGDKMDIIFVDPPYNSKLGQIAVEYIIEKDLIKEDGVIYYEHGDEIEFTPPKGYKTRTKKMGYTIGEFITKSKIAMLTGSFDPMTKGHEALLDEALQRYDEIVVACLVNEQKTYFFTPEERVKIAESVVSDKKGVRVVYSEDMAVDTARREGAAVFIRGIRNDSDMAYEEEMRQYNLEYGGIDTDIIKLDGYEDISSTSVKEEIAKGNYKHIPASAIFTVMDIVSKKQG